MAGEHGTALADMLSRAAMNPRQLVTQINGWLISRGLEDRRIDVTAAYSWVKHGYKPYDPIPSVAAAVLSERLGHPITVDELWPDKHLGRRAGVTAVEGFELFASLDDAVRALGDLTVFSTGRHADVTAASGSDLTAIVHHGMRTELALPLRRPQRDLVLESQVRVIGDHVAALRRLDDRHGGGSLSMRYLTGELRMVLDLLQSADYEPTAGRLLMTVVADLAQLVGWVHFDAHRYGAAERYLLLSDRVARGIGDLGRAANAIGMLSYVSAFAGHGQEAVHIAAAAEHACPNDVVLRARIIGRSATAFAAAGDLSNFRRQSEKARMLLDGYRPTGTPGYLYYMEPEQLTAEAGQALVVLADRVLSQRKPLLREAVTLLGPISEVGQRPDYPRSAMLHGTFLTKAHLLLGDLDSAVHSARSALARTTEVQSIRAITELRSVRPAFARRQRSQVVSDFLPEFDAALPRI